MNQEKISDIVQALLIQQFQVQPESFTWEQPLEMLQEDFRSLSQLLYLEQLLKKEFEQDLPLLENISTAFHTPQDLVQLLMDELLPI